MFVSTGISISSINRIKELAEQKKFKEALEILDTQDLDKSINPQFLRISGEIFRENKRYYDSRKFLLKAHQMAPQGNRIIRELIELYLELGYFSKAQKYYEQYMFYTTPEDTQKDYVEYIMKKATGANVKELAAILIPILERMPGDDWNFEAVLLYHKMERKDMALEESRYILENFKESVYVQPVIDYIEDILDVDEWFYVYPKEEVPEDVELYADLIEQEEKLLEADYLMMYPPEARIMVEADDNDAVDVKLPKEKKEKKPKKMFGKNSKKQEALSEGVEEQSLVSNDNSDTKGTVKQSDEDKIMNEDSGEKEVSQVEIPEVTSSGSKVDGEKIDSAMDSEEVLIKKEREAALEKILSRKIDKDKLIESAQQAAQAVKEIDVSHAKQQVKNVVGAVKDNVKKASDVFGEAVGAKQSNEKTQDVSGEGLETKDEEILDGIIESVLEPPKKMVGEIVVNEELDALIPDSLEAMSEQEAADIEARKEEMERLELEALEASLKLEEEKKAKKHAKSIRDGVDEEKQSMEESSLEIACSDDTEVDNLTVEPKQETEGDLGVTSVPEENDDSEETSKTTSETLAVAESENTLHSQQDADVEDVVQSDGVTYAELKSQFMEEKEIQPLDSLGFITVVHSDVDDTLEDEVPDAAGILRQMIDNKEFYSGENSLGFESKASYENHGFEVEDYDFDVYRMKQESITEQETDIQGNLETKEDIVSVEEIYTKESVVAFEDVVFSEVVEEKSIICDEDAYESRMEVILEETVWSDTAEVIPEETVWSDVAEVISEETVWSDTAEVISKKTVWSDTVETIPEETVWSDAAEVISEETVWSDTTEVPSEEIPVGEVSSDVIENDHVCSDVEETTEAKREKLRADIILSNQMENLLLELKESR